MNKLRPILQGSPSKMERLLLSSSQIDVPPRNAQKRAFAALGIGGSVIATTQVTGVATATAATGTGAVAATGATAGFALALLKGLAIGAVAGTIAYGSLTVLRGHKLTAPAPTKHAVVQTMTSDRNRIEHANGPERASVDVPAAAPAYETGSLSVADIATPAAVAQAKQPVTVPLRQAPKSARGDSARQVPGVAPDRGAAVQTMRVAAVTPSALPEQKQPTFPEERPSLKSERAAIELAQALVRSGDPAAALRSLSNHQRWYPNPQLGPEAMLVRIEALRRLGQLLDAQRLGLQFLAAQPDGPYSQRVRSLLNLPTTP